MGICASCLGWDKEEDEDSTNPLLFDDPTNTNYGSINPLDHTPPASTGADQRNDKELENIVNLAARKLIPIYDPLDHHAPTMSPYRDLVNKLSEENLGDLGDVERGGEEEDGWGSEEESDSEGVNGAATYADVVRRERPEIGPCTTTLKQSEAK